LAEDGAEGAAWDLLATGRNDDRERGAAGLAVLDVAASLRDEHKARVFEAPMICFDE
jgi:hypothetical protein